jgi:hypothetical protein
VQTVYLMAGIVGIPLTGWLMRVMTIRGAFCRLRHRIYRSQHRLGRGDRGSRRRVTQLPATPQRVKAHPRAAGELDLDKTSPLRPVPTPATLRHNLHRVRR